MCGINGIINYFKKPVEASQLKEMNNLMVHRGPDDEGYFLEENVGLSMRRLSIIDLNTGQQPQMSQDQNIVVVFNGEIYNHIELRKKLSCEGHQFKTKNSDTEVIIQGYKKKGISILEDLNGMFAFALFDKKKRKVFIARDRLGIKPLFYSLDKDGLIFSSSLKSLTSAKKKLKDKIRKKSFLEYMGQSFISGPNSIFEGVKKLRPAHYLEVRLESSEAKETQYWLLNSFEKLKLMSQESYQSEIFEKFQSSINLRQRSDVPVGTFLSGGLDSSTVVGMIRNSLGATGEIHTFSVGFKGGNNELPMAKLVSEKYNTHHFELLINETDVVNSLPNIIKFMDEPLFDNAIIPTYLLSKEAKKRGVKVIINGTGGDEIFGGYTRYFPNSLTRKLLFKAPSFALKAGSMVLKPINRNKSHMMAHRELLYTAELSGVNFDFMEKFISNESDFNQFKKSLLDRYGDYFRKSRKSKRRYPLMLKDLQHYMVDDILSLLDKMTMANSIEGRVPFLDHNMVELCYNIPDKIKFKKNEPKYIMKQSFSSILPKEILNLPKKGFGGPTSHWIKKTLTPMIHQSLIEDPIPFFRNHFDKDSLNQLFCKKRKIKDGFDQTAFGLFIFSLWYKEHVLEN